MNTTNYILIADGGSTKVEWCLIDINGDVKASFQTEGLNALMVSEEDAEAYFISVRKRLDPSLQPGRIYYYGAGCATLQICTRIADAISRVWDADTIGVESDMLAACRAVLGKAPGIACILGTGSNSALYDGSEITDNIPPMGFILGDEGSGTAIGKRLVGDIFKRIAPVDICEAFLESTKLTKGDILEKTYREPAPNKFLASLVPFVKNNLSHPYIRRLLEKTFTEFFERNILSYGDLSGIKVSFIGSIADVFSDILQRTGDKFGIVIDKITPRPMPGLITFHITNPIS